MTVPKKNWNKLFSALKLCRLEPQNSSHSFLLDLGAVASVLHKMPDSLCHIKQKKVVDKL